LIIFRSSDSEHLVFVDGCCARSLDGVSVAFIIMDRLVHVVVGFGLWVAAASVFDCGGVFIIEYSLFSSPDATRPNIF
jgi:hypothetical protein